MDTEYDFTQIVLNSQQLLDEISTAGLPTPNYINTDTSTNILAIFYTSPLTSDQVTTLTNLVSNYTDTTGYVTLAMQSQINTLIGYLNNSNTTTANTARAIIVENIAPNMPISLIETINTQIATTLNN